ncbi:unnamed protein product [Pleuronectes platessa]|uniref:Uncharacterized protein n=1 Tax=Pleuronectes platessa TaxID=8262 RepID=A0A9N7UJH2_PLEPL|nr:unnamed protein product [Pleuronectes platessa]
MRPNSVPRARRIRSISGPSTKPLQQMNQRYPARAMTSSPNSGDSLTACTPRNTTRDSLDFWKIRATRKQHREGHSDRPPSCLRPNVVTGVINLHLETPDVLSSNMVEIGSFRLVNMRTTCTTFICTTLHVFLP